MSFFQIFFYSIIGIIVLILAIKFLTRNKTDNYSDGLDNQMERFKDWLSGCRKGL